MACLPGLLVPMLICNLMADLETQILPLSAGSSSHTGLVRIRQGPFQQRYVTARPGHAHYVDTQDT